MKKKVEMRNDGHDADRFEELLKVVVNVPRDEIKKREAKEQKEKEKKKR